jgi:hypothetical protein
MHVSQTQESGVAVGKSALGIQVMKDRSVSMSAQQRSALILCDGKRSAQDVVSMTAAVGVTMQDIQTLLDLGLVVMNAVVAPSSAALPISPALAQTTAEGVANVAPQETPAPSVDFSAALNTAITVCSNLGFKGFGLNMALTGVDSLEKLQKMAPEIRKAAGDVKYKPLHELIFGKAL